MTRHKISIFGAGEVGVACGYLLLLRKISNHIVFIDKNQRKLDAEILDLEGCVMNGEIVEGSSNNFSIIVDSRVCIMAAGARIFPGETKMEQLHKNIDIFRSIIPHIVRYCPKCIIIVVTNPIDILSYFTWKISKFPASRVFGTGHLYSKVFQYTIAERLNVSPNIVNAWIVGEYGDSGVPLWSNITVGGNLLTSYFPNIAQPDDPERFTEVRKELLSIPHIITTLKGSVAWASAFCVVAIVNSIVLDKNELYSVSILAKGICGIEKELFLSVPCEIGLNGATRAVIPNMNEEELKNWKKSGDVMEKKLRKCTFWTVHSV